ncbi:MAG: PilZ domain-containing protein [Deltaproteobacteria bacterium]|nr:PilZ domain-containing protein [Deltaproteobacteria bacterium]
MKGNKARRLSVRVPAIGWEARIWNEKAKKSTAKVCNVSADGAYLITTEHYEPASRLALSITSPLICFSVTGLVVRKDPFGLAVRFLDHSESIRSSLLNIISKSLAEKRSRPSLVTETPVYCESQPKGTVDLEGECFYASALLATEPGREEVGLKKNNSKRPKDSCLMIGLAQTECKESLRVFLSDSGKTTVRCPSCGKRHHTQVPKHFHNKPVRGTCTCGESFPVLFDSRKYYRKQVRLPGEYWNTLGEKHLMTVTTLSFSGAGFEAGLLNPSISSGETIRLNFLLKRNDKIWIRSSALVRRVNGNQIGVDFTGMDEHQQKCLGFFLMP